MVLSVIDGNTPCGERANPCVLTGTMRCLLVPSSITRTHAKRPYTEKRETSSGATDNRGKSDDVEPSSRTTPRMWFDREDRGSSLIHYTRSFGRVYPIQE